MLFRRFVLFRNLYNKVGKFVHHKHNICMTKCHLIKPHHLLLVSPAYAVKIKGQSNEVLSESHSLEPKVLLRNASICAVDAATSLLTHSTCRLLQQETEYVEALRDLVTLLEANISSLDNEYQQTQIWDAILSVRHRVNRIKQEKLETEAVYQSAVRMLESAAEAAHGSGADYAGIAGSERLFSARSQVNHAAELSSELEQRLHRQEVKNIEATGKHEEKLKKRKQQEALEQQQEKESETSKSETSKSETNNSDKDNGEENTS